MKVEEICKAGMRRVYAQSVWNRYRASGIGLDRIPLLDEQDAFLQDSGDVAPAVDADAAGDQD